MHIKRFEATTMEAALAQVKAELGPDALILSSRTFRRGRHSFATRNLSSTPNRKPKHTDFCQPKNPGRQEH